MDDLDVIHEQIEYNRRRAAEYDVTVTPLYDALASFIDELAAALDRFRPVGDVLEIASGTGAWTLALLRHDGAAGLGEMTETGDTVFLPLERLKTERRRSKRGVPLLWRVSIA